MTFSMVLLTTLYVLWWLYGKVKRHSCQHKKPKNCIRPTLEDKDNDRPQKASKTKETVDELHPKRHLLGFLSQVDAHIDHNFKRRIGYSSQTHPNTQPDGLPWKWEQSWKDEDEYTTWEDDIVVGDLFFLKVFDQKGTRYHRKRPAAEEKGILCFGKMSFGREIGNEGTQSWNDDTVDR